MFIPLAQNAKDFLTQTDLFYSYQCNETIFKVGKWRKSYEISLKTFNRFCEKPCLALATLWILKYSAKKVVFLVSSGKIKFLFKCYRGT